VVNNAGNWLLRLIYEGLLGWEFKGWRRDKEDKCAKGNEEDVHHGGRGQSLRPHSGMWRENGSR